MFKNSVSRKPNTLKLNNLSLFLSALSLQLCLTLFDPMVCSPPSSSVHGIFPARILVWVTISSSKGSAQGESNLYLLHWQADSLPLSHWESPGISAYVSLFILMEEKELNKNIPTTCQVWTTNVKCYILYLLSIYIFILSKVIFMLFIHSIVYFFFYECYICPIIHIPNIGYLLY